MQFHPEASLETVFLVERCEPHEIVGEWREPNGDNPSWFHLAQSRVRRKQQFEFEFVESLLTQWRERASSDTESSTRSDMSDTDSTSDSDDEHADLLFEVESDDDLDLYISFEYGGS